MGGVRREDLGNVGTWSWSLGCNEVIWERVNTRQTKKEEGVM